MVKLPLIQDVSIPAGLITYPLTFLLSDLVTEIFGPKKAKFMVYMALAMNLLSFGIIQIALTLPSKTENEQLIFRSVLGLSGLRIFSSLTAYLVSQIVDIQLYALIKKWTGTKYLWLRNNGSTFVSQMIDTIILDVMYLSWGLGMGLDEVMPTMFISFIYKTVFSIANTPLLYLSVFVINTSWKLDILKPSFRANHAVVYERKL
jgi:queuosine precursor transporter